MTTQEILNQLNRQLPDHSIEVAGLNPYAIADFLLVSGEALISLIRAIQNEQTGSDESMLSEIGRAHV